MINACGSYRVLQNVPECTNFLIENRLWIDHYKQ